MGIVELLLISFGVSVDAFAVSIGGSLCKPLLPRRIQALNAALFFGFFQGFMPLIGYILGVGFHDKVSRVDHWIAFILLGVIGINMLKEATSKEEECKNDSVKFREMIVLAIATSIDALAVGITMAFLEVNIIFAVLLIGIITFVISTLGVKIGNFFGDKYEKKAELFGGVILLLIGTKILLEHLDIIKF